MSCGTLVLKYPACSAATGAPEEAAGQRCRGATGPSAEAEADVVGRVVQPLAGVLADVAVAPVNHDAQHVALNDFGVHSWLEMRVNAGGKEGAAPAAPAVVPEEAVGDGAGPAV